MSIMRQAVIAGLLALIAHPADAQLNPSRQITIVVPIGAGGGVDATGRLIAEKLQERLKQPVVVENRPAGGGMVGADSVAKAAPDGHTLLLMETSSVLHKWLHTNVPYDVVTDFAPIARVATSPMILFAQPSFAANDARELIALAKAQPGKLSVGTPGIGTPHHLAMLMLNALAKIDIVNVPYRGAALVLNDVLAGQIPLGWAAPTAVMPHVASGKVKVLAVASGAARAGAAAGADHRRRRRAGLRPRHLVRRLRSGENAAGCPRALRQRDRRHLRAARLQGADRQDRSDHGLSRRCEIRPVDPHRPRALRQDHPRRRHQAELKNRTLYVIIVGGGLGRTNCRP